MHFHIKAIILWPRTGDFEPRIVRFQEAVNVISGVSRTGKSAIIPIVDYCLASDKCTIPVATIRDACEWFGLLVETDEGEKLLARKEPGHLRSTNEMFVMEGNNLQIPHRIGRGNATSEIIKSRLDEIAGLTSLDFETGSTSGFKSRPSFRDLVAFVFQPQNVVANPNVLFYKADSYEHREKLRTILPYVLGAITPSILAKQHELEELRRALRRKQHEMENLKQVSERIVAEVRSYVDRAKELGILGSKDKQEASIQQAIALLKEVVSSNRTTTGVTVTTINGAADELVLLRQKEQEASTQLAQLRQRYFEMTEMKKAAADYKTALLVQRDRLSIASWLTQQTTSEHECPICGSAFDRQQERIRALLESLEQIENLSGQFQPLPQTFDREYQRVRREITRLSESLDGITSRLKALQQFSKEEEKKQYTQLSISRFLGRLESDLRTMDLASVDNTLLAEIHNLEVRIRELESQVDAKRVRGRLDRAVRDISSIAARFLPQLDTERPNDTMELAISDLSVRVLDVDRVDYLWEIGSGSNWLSYHVAASVSLQLHSLKIEQSPVPTFLVYDQPSQVYFPKRLVERGDGASVEEPEFKDEDVQAVRKVFNVLSTVVKESEKQLQFIVLDHAPESVWAGIEGVHLVEDWREGRKLVPQAWLGKP